MKTGGLWLVLLRLCALGIMAGVLFGVSAAGAATRLTQPTTGATPGQLFKVTSNLDGKAVLPHRIHWLGRSTLRPSQISKVDFLIDGTVRWIETRTPFVYGGDDNGTNMGYLVTSWIRPGEHRFAVQVIATDGHKATDTVRARVLPSPEPPSALAGTWQRTIDTSAAPKAGSAGNPTSTLTPSGTYTITFEKRWVRDNFPGKYVFPASNKTGAGFINLDDYTANASTVHVVGPVIFHVPRPHDEGAENSGFWCYASGPPADYRWTVTGNKLTLAPNGGHDACGIRGFIWTGSWKRVG
jgi:hypothetical protein